MEPIKFPTKLQPVFSPKRYKVLHGGRGGAKSWSVARYLVILGVSRPIRVLCCREYQKSIKDSVLTLLEDQIKVLGLEGHYQILHNEIRGNNGTQFNFEGLSQNVQGIKSYEGVDFVWVEEANAVTKKSWDILIPTIRKEGSEIWVTFNPEFEDDYAYERWVFGEDPFAIVIEINWRDNPWFPDVLNEERIAHKKRDPDTYEHVWEGKPLKWLEGAIYARQLRKAFEEERIGRCPHDENVRVFTAWDIGRTDDTAIWFYQVVSDEVHIIDFEAASGESPSYFASMILGRWVQINIVAEEVEVLFIKNGKADKSVTFEEADRVEGKEHRLEYQYGVHWLPHDARAKKFEAHGKSTKDQLRAVLGWDKVDIVRNLSQEDGIQAARTMFPKCWFDRERCQDGIKSLRKYKRESQQDEVSLKAKPKHDIYSHAADAFRYLAAAYEFSVSESVEERAPKVDYFDRVIMETESQGWKVAL